MDIKKIVEELIEKITKDEKTMTEFKKNPIKVVEKLLNIDLPDEAIEKVVEGVKAKITFDKVSDGLKVINDLLGKKD